MWDANQKLTYTVEFHSKPLYSILVFKFFENLIFLSVEIFDYICFSIFSQNFSILWWTFHLSFSLDIFFLKGIIQQPFFLQNLLDANFSEFQDLVKYTYAFPNFSQCYYSYTFLLVDSSLPISHKTLNSWNNGILWCMQYLIKPY